MELSKTAYVILGILQLGKRCGYEIKSLVDVSTRFFWAASYGQIYPELARLEEAGLVKGKPDRSNGRGRKTYELTRAGGRALEEWLTSDESLHIEFRHEGALKLFFSDFLPVAQRREQLRRIRAAHEEVADQLRAVRPGAQQAADETGRRLPYLTLEFGIAFQEFVADWCERAERELAPKTTTRS